MDIARFPMTELSINKKRILLTPNADKEDFLVGNCSELIKKILTKKEDNLEKTPEEIKLHKLSKAYPGREILSSFEIGDNFHQTIFLGVKDLNTKHGLTFTDTIIKRIKKELKDVFSNILNVDCDIIWDDYKNFTIKIGKITKEQKKLLSNITAYFQDKFLYQIYKEELVKQSLVSKFHPNDFPLKLNSDLDKIKEKKPTQLNNNTINNNYKYRSIYLSLANSREKLEQKSAGHKHSYIDFMNEGYIIEFLNDFKDETKVKTTNGTIIDVEVKKYSSKEKIIINKTTKEIIENEDIDTIYAVRKNSFKLIEQGEISSFSIFSQKKDDNPFNINPKLYEYYINNKIPKELFLHKNITNTFYTQNSSDTSKENTYNNKISTVYQETLRKEDKVYYVNEKSIKITDLNGKVLQYFLISSKKYGFYNKQLLSKIRKKELPLELIIVQKIKRIMDFVTIQGEFIFPEWENIESENYKDKITEYEKIKTYIKNGTNEEIVNEYLKGYYKGGYNSEYFYKKIENKEGSILMYDIKDLGVYNICSHNYELQKALKGEQSVEQVKLNSGKFITDKIKYIPKSPAIKNKIKTLGGDEGTVYIANYTNEVQQIQEKSKDLKIFSRIVLIDFSNKITKNINSNIESPFSLVVNGDEKNNVLKKIENLFDLIEARLNLLMNEVYRINNEIFKSEISIESKDKTSDILKREFNNEDEKLKILSIFRDSYIHYSKGKWLLKIGRNGNTSFNINDIIDIEGNLLENSDFLDFLDNNGLGRSKMRIKK